MPHDPALPVLVLRERIAKGPEAHGVGTGHGIAGLDFQDSEVAMLFEKEVHFGSVAFTPEVESAVEQTERAPRLQRLEQGLLQADAASSRQPSRGLVRRRLLERLPPLFVGEMTE